MPPDRIATDATLNTPLREFLDDRNPVHPSTRGLVRYMAPEDALSVMRCADAHLRMADPKTGPHDIRMRQFP